MTYMFTLRYSVFRPCIISTCGFGGRGKKTVGFLKLFSYIFTPTLGLISLMYRQSRAVGGRGQPGLLLAALARCASKGSRACDA